MGHRLLAVLDVVRRQRLQGGDGGDAVPSLVGVDAQGNLAAHRLADGADPRHIIIAGAAQFYLDRRKALLLELQRVGRHLGRIADGDGHIGVDLAVIFAP